MSVSNAAFMITHISRLHSAESVQVIMLVIILKSRGCFHPKQQIPEQFQELPSLGLSASDGNPISTLGMNTLGA